MIWKSKSLIPLAVALFVFAAAYTVSNAQRSGLETRLEDETTVVSRDLASRLQREMQARLTVARLVQGRIQDGGIIDPVSMSRETAVLTNLYSDTKSIVWFQEGQEPVQIFSAPETALLPPAMETAPALARALRADTAAATATPSTLVENAHHELLVVYLPLQVETDLHTVLGIAFGTKSLLEATLGDAVRSFYSFTVEEGVRASNPAEQIGQTTRTAGFRAWDNDWTVSATPNDLRLEYARSSVDEYILAFGGASALILLALTQRLITRRQALSISQKRFRDFAHASSDWFWETDDQLRFSFITEGIETCLGLNRTNLIGQRIGKFRAPGDVVDWDDFQRALAERRPFKDLTYSVLVGQQTKWVRGSGVPQFDRDGNFRGYRGVGTDVTEVKRARDFSEKANAQLASAVEDLDIMFCLWDERDRLVFGNRMFRELNKRIPDHLDPGTPFRDFMRAALRAGDIPGAEGREEEFIANEIAARQDPQSYFKEIHRSNGSILQLNQRRLPNGFLASVAYDITRQRANEQARRSSEERLELALEQVSIWDWDVLHDKVYMSPGFAGRLGYSPAEFEEIKRSSVANIMHPDDLQTYLEKLQDHLKHPQNGFLNEHRFKTKSGSFRRFLAIGKAFTNDQGETVRSAGVLTDITEQTELAEQLQQAQKMEAIGNLTGGVAHDFNNLLAVILGNLELLEDVSDPQKAEEYRTDAIKAAERGAALTQNMLSFARKAQMSPVSIGLNDLIDEAKTWWMRVLPANIELKTVLEIDIPPVRLDPSLAQTALLNLVVNAKDAMPDGGTLTIRTSKTWVHKPQRTSDGTIIPSGKFICLEITDTGEGMSADTLAKVFDPFFTTKPQGAGSGLGLSMVEGFVRQSGGHVNVSSQQSEGTTFRLMFPASATAQPKRAAENTAEPTQSHRRRAKILLVEDEPDVRKVVVATLERAGYEIETATSGDEAVKGLDDGISCDLLLSDVAMPGKLQGTDLARLLQEKHPDIPIVLMTGFASEPLNKPVGVFRQLMKPVGKHELLSTLQDALYDPQDVDPE